MNGTLVIADCIEGHLTATTPNLVAAAAALREPITLGVVTAGDNVAAQVGFAGVDALVAVRAPSGAFDSDISVAAVRLMIEAIQPRVVLMAYSIRSAAYAAALAETLDLGFASDVVAIAREADGTLLVTRPVYGGKVYAEFAVSADVPALLLLRADIWPAAEAGGPPAVRELPLGAMAQRRVHHVEYRRPEAGVDLARADVIFAVGRGVGEQSNIEPFAAVARRMDVALGASRPIVDAGWLPAPHQVGQTGVTVKPRLYVAFGISGAVQHLAGMQASNTIVAVNNDPDAAIFDFADVGAVADINEVAKHMQALLERT